MSVVVDRIPAEALRRFASDVFIAKGMDAQGAGTVADALLWADLRGVGTHGVARVPQYCKFIDQGDLDPRAVPERVLDLPAAARIDGRGAAGPVALQMAVGVAAGKARAAGIGMALVAGTTHTGALGRYTQALAQQGFAAIAVSASNPLMVYHGAAAAGAGTNPLSIAMPDGERAPILFDMATSATSMGHLLQARRDREALAPGLAVDGQGQPVTDPQLAKWVLPLGGPKGSGLSLMIELLASHLGGNSLVAEALEQTPLGRRHRQNALLIAIDCARFLPPALLGEMAQRLARDLHALPASAAGGEVLLPGERGNREAERRLAAGIPLSPPVRAELAAMAQSLALDVRGYWA
jgi:LDH2 family malate/lactate/ureidoglycolate dehydrogenase